MICVGVFVWLEHHEDESIKIYQVGDESHLCQVLRNKLVSQWWESIPADMASGRARCPVDNGFASTETECRLAGVRSRSMSCNCMTRTSTTECTEAFLKAVSLISTS